jgi:TolB-like protein
LFEARLLRASKAEEARALYAAAVKEDPALANLYGDLRAQFRDVSATVAVLPFVNASGRAEDAWMGVGVVDALATDLPRLGFTTLERQRIDDVLLARGDGGAIVEGALAASAGQLLNADYTVIGSVLHQAPAIRIDLRVIEVRSGIIAYTSSAENRRNDLPAAIVALTTQLASRFNAPLSSDDLDELVAAKMTPVDFERAFRAELAKKNLRDSARRDGAAPGVAAAPAGALPWGTIAGGTGVAVGLTTAITGFVLADPFVVAMHQAEGRIDVLPPDVDLSKIAAEARTAENNANVRLVAAWTGVAIAAASAAWLVVDGLLPDEAAPAAPPPSSPAPTATPSSEEHLR